MEKVADNTLAVGAAIDGLKQDSKKDVQDVIKSTADMIKPLVEAVSRQTDAINRQTRIMSLQWAITNVGKYPLFKSNTTDKAMVNVASIQNTEVLVINILKGFLSGTGYYVDTYFRDDDGDTVTQMCRPTYSESALGKQQKQIAIDAAKGNLQISLIKLVHELTGEKPIIRSDNGRHAIFQANEHCL